MESATTLPAGTTVAFVTPWYGEAIPGGMESETRRTAAQLSETGLDVEVLTTCIRDFYADWGVNFHRPGVTHHGKVKIRRFPVERRDRVGFDTVNARLMAGGRVQPGEEQTYITEMIKSPQLLDFISEQCDRYVFVFIPYMFATTHFGLQRCPRRSIVIPCLHDESYAYMGIYRDSLPRAAAMVLHTNAERVLADTILGRSSTQQRLVFGEGVDMDIDANAARFHARFGIDRPFLLYAGRREPGKNTPLLLRYWERYRAQHDDERLLVLIGPGDVDTLPPHTVDLGFVSRQEKYDALSAAQLLIMPSVNESFSLIVMESWISGTPVLVHGSCAVTREHVHRSNGGLYFANYDEFAATIRYLRDHPDQRAQMAANGKAYVLRNYRWDAIVDAYRALITQIAAGKQHAY